MVRELVHRLVSSSDTTMHVYTGESTAASRLWATPGVVTPGFPLNNVALAGLLCDRLTLKGRKLRAQAGWQFLGPCTQVQGRGPRHQGGVGWRRRPGVVSRGVAPSEPPHTTHHTPHTTTTATSTTPFPPPPRLPASPPPPTHTTPHHTTPHHTTPHHTTPHHTTPRHTTPHRHHTTPHTKSTSHHNVVFQ